MSEQSYWQRTAGRRLSRRGVLRGSAVAGLGLAGAALIGCGDDDDDEEAAAPAAQAPAPAGATTAPAQPTQAAAPEEQINRGGIVKDHRTRAITGHFDPHINLNNQLAPWHAIGNFGTDMTQDGEEVLPELLESWEIPGDGTEMIAKVRSNAKWHNRGSEAGRALTAEDAVFNIMDIGALLRPERATEFHSRSVMVGLIDAEAIDEKTVKINFAHPTSTFLAGISHYRTHWYSKDFEKGGGDFTKPEELVGTGAFTIEKFIEDQRVEYKANPEYWKEGQPYLDGYTNILLPDNTVAITQLQQGGIHFMTAAGRVDRETIDKLVSDRNMRVWDFISWIHWRFQVNRKPFDDVRVRRALFLVPDYLKMNSEFFGDGFWNWAGAMSAAYPEAYQAEDLIKMPGYNPDTKEQDIKDAVALMTAAGFPDGEIDFGITHGPFGGYIQGNPIRIQADLQRVWPKMGAKLDTTADSPSFAKRQAGADFDTISYTIHGVPDGILELISDFGTLDTHGGTGGGRNYGRHSNPEIDDLLVKAVRELDSEARKKIAREVQDIAIATMPTVGISSDRGARAFRPEVGNWERFGGRTMAGGRGTGSRVQDLWLKA